jgi:hypothetical protein
MCSIAERSLSMDYDKDKVDGMTLAIRVRISECGVRNEKKWDAECAMHDKKRSTIIFVMLTAEGTKPAAELLKKLVMIK